MELLSRIKQAQTQLAGKASQENRDDYYFYLLTLEEAIHNEQKSITDALFYRIKLVFSYNNLHAHNPLRELLLSFKELGIDSIQNVKISDLLSNNFLTETQDNFSVAKAYYLILTHGSEAQKAVVRPFFILGTDTHSTPVPLKQKANYSFVPQSLIHFIPRLPQFIINFFPGLKLRAQFFQDKAELFFKLARVNNGLHSFSPPWNLENSAWQNLNDLQEELEKEQKHAQSLQSTLLPWFQNTSRAFLAEWQSLLTKQKELVTLKQIDFLTQMASAPLPLDSLFNDNQEVNGYRQTLIETLERVETQVIQSKLNEKECEQFYRMKSQIRKRWNIDAYRPESSIESILSYIANEKPLPKETFSSFKSEILAYSDDGLEIIALDYEKLLQKISNNIQTKILKLYAALAEKPFPMLSVCQQSVKQSAQTISLFSKTNISQKDPSIIAGKQLLIDLVMKYKECIKQNLIGPESTAMDFGQFEKILHIILFSHPEWEEFRNEIFKIELFRNSKLNLDRAYSGDESELISAPNELGIDARLEKQKEFIIDEDQKNLEMKQIREQLARFGIYYSKNKEVGSQSTELIIRQG